MCNLGNSSLSLNKIFRQVVYPWEFLFPLSIVMCSGFHKLTICVISADPVFKHEFNRAFPPRTVCFSQYSSRSGGPLALQFPHITLPESKSIDLQSSTEGLSFLSGFTWMFHGGGMCMWLVMSNSLSMFHLWRAQVKNIFGFKLHWNWLFLKSRDPSTCLAMLS